jgi:hypothetical protein
MENAHSESELCGFIKRISQFVVSSLIFCLLGSYVVLIQRALDQAEGEILKASLIGGGLLSGGFVYDSWKHLIFMDSNLFWDFSYQFVKTAVSIIVMLAPLAISVLFFDSDSMKDKVSTVWLWAVAALALCFVNINILKLIGKGVKDN